MIKNLKFVYQICMGLILVSHFLLVFSMEVQKDSKDSLEIIKILPYAPYTGEEQINDSEGFDRKDQSFYNRCYGRSHIFEVEKEEISVVYTIKHIKKIGEVSERIDKESERCEVIKNPILTWHQTNLEIMKTIKQSIDDMFSETNGVQSNCLEEFNKFRGRNFLIVGFDFIDYINQSNFHVDIDTILFSGEKGAENFLHKEGISKLLCDICNDKTGEKTGGKQKYVLQKIFSKENISNISNNQLRNELIKLVAEEKVQSEPLNKKIGEIDKKKQQRLKEQINKEKLLQNLRELKDVNSFEMYENWLKEKEDIGKIDKSIIELDKKMRHLTKEC